MEKTNKDSYKQIFRSTGIVGGAQVLNILIGILKTKVIAILLGPAGVGVAGIFQTIVDLVRNATGLGINFSGVKSVAEHNGDPEKVARIILVLRRWEFGTGIVGTLVIIILCGVFSQNSFGNSSYTFSIAILSVVLLFNAISSGQLAILQGLRHIAEMAKASFLGSVLGMFISLLLYWWLGMDGIIPAMIMTAISSLLISWIFAKKVITQAVNLTVKETFVEGLDMAKLGFYIVFNGFVATGAMYVLRMLIRSHLGIEYVGYFQSVWTISTLYIGILLNAMLADYFPSLSQIQHDNIASNKLVNEQLEITMLLGVPMLMGMIVFAPLALNILYSSSFVAAIPILRWQMMASFFTFIGWPLGVIYLSKNSGWFAIISETLRQAVFILIVFFGWKYWGFNVLGIGFFIGNFINAAFVWWSVTKITNFKFSVTNALYIGFLGTAMLAVTFCSLWLTGIYQFLINGVILTATVIFCITKLQRLLDLKNWITTKAGKTIKN
jgi:antigen flippase